MSSPATLAQVIALTVLLGAISPQARAAGPAPAANSAAAAAQNPAFERCRARADVDACYDALRRNPSDPVLLVALGDALAHANRPADALREMLRILRPGGSLRDISPTILSLLNLDQPNQMTGGNLKT